MVSQRGPPGGKLAVRSLRRDTRLVRGRGVPISASSRPRRYHPDIAASEFSHTPFWEPIRPKRELAEIEPAAGCINSTTLIRKGPI